MMFKSPFLMHASYAIMQTAMDSRIAPTIGDRKDYVPWNPMYFEEGAKEIWRNIGTAFNIGIWIFIIITGVYLVVKLVDHFGG